MQNNPTVQFFDKTNVDKLPWPDNECSRFAKDFLVPMLLHGTSHYIDNVHATLQIALYRDLILPLVINDQDRFDNSYVCSSHSLYIGYGKEELKLINNKTLRKMLEGLLSIFGAVLRIGNVDKTVYVNNWLLPTNLYHPISQEDIRILTTELIKRFPNHSIAFRSINTIHPQDLLVNLKNSGFAFLISRMIYYTDTQNPEPFASRMFKSDLNLYEKSPYQKKQTKALSIESAERICKLYRMLNIEKHSSYNPQFNANFVHMIASNPVFTLQTFELNGQIDAALGYFHLGKVMTSPFFAYDTSLPQKIGLYRKISTLLLLDAKEKMAWLHQSGGGGSFKKLRRAEDALEYTAVYYRHLPLRSQLPWKILEKLVNPLFKRFLRSYTF